MGFEPSEPVSHSDYYNCLFLTMLRYNILLFSIQDINQECLLNTVIVSEQQISELVGYSYIFEG